MDIQEVTNCRQAPYWGWHKDILSSYCPKTQQLQQLTKLLCISGIWQEENSFSLIQCNNQECLHWKEAALLVFTQSQLYHRGQRSIPIDRCVPSFHSYGRTSSRLVFREATENSLVSLLVHQGTLGSLRWNPVVYSLPIHKPLRVHKSTASTLLWWSVLGRAHGAKNYTPQVAEAIFTPPQQYFVLPFSLSLSLLKSCYISALLKYGLQE